MDDFEYTSFRYMKWLDLYNIEKPFQVLIDLPADVKDRRRSNIEFRVGESEKVHDVRKEIGSLDLDKHGFMFIKHQTALRTPDFQSKDSIEQVYVPECKKLLQSSMEKVDRVHVFNWLTRNTDTASAVGKERDLNEPIATLGPGTVAHVDQTFPTVVERILMELPDEAERLLRGRVRLVNIWRPINGPVESFPLALCDGRTVPMQSLVPADRIRRKWTGGTTFMLETPGANWSFLRGQENDEVAIFKSFDSEEGVTKYAPHCSFPLSAQNPTSRPRQSIEVRALVFTYPTVGQEVINSV